MFSALITRLASTVFAMVLLAASILCSLEISAGWLGNDPVLLGPNFAQDLRMRAWDDQAIGLIIIALGVAGVVALFVGIRANTRLTIQSDSLIGVHIERRSLEQALSRKLEHLDGVDSARVRASSKLVKAQLESKRQYSREPIEQMATVEIINWIRQYGIEPDVKVVLTARDNKA
jgi:Family of unknown function (DUF6286)